MTASDPSTTYVLASIAIALLAVFTIVFLLLASRDRKRDAQQRYAYAQTCYCGHSRIDHIYDGRGPCTNIPGRDKCGWVRSGHVSFASSMIYWVTHLSDTMESHQNYTTC